MIIEPCHCGGLPYVGMLIRTYDTFYGVYCMECGNCESIEWTDDEAIKCWNDAMDEIKNKS